MNREKLNAIFGIVAIIVLFVLASYITRRYHDLIYNLIGDGFYGIAVYLLIVILSIVVAPFGMIPLIPLAVGMWGVFYATALNIIGWTLGAVVVFFICRKYGVPLVRKIVSLESIYKMESKIPKDNLFVSIIILRMMIPVDVLSYALGLFSKVDFKTYLTATIIGITPFAILFSYLGMAPTFYQILGILLIILLIWVVRRFYKKSN